MPVTSARVKALAGQIGFDLSGVARALPLPEFPLYQQWVSDGYAGAMGYLADHRAERRADPRSLLPSAKSIICVAKLYNTPYPYSNEYDPEDSSWISRYAWGDDYHDLIRSGLERLVAALEAEAGPFDHKICVDTAPLLERSYARMAGLGWIGKNTCLIHQGKGSWYFLGEVLVSLDLVPDSPPPDRCGTCRRCIDACPTEALVPAAGGRWTLDSRLCISYLTIELRGAVPEHLREGVGRHVFGCDICQEVCPWNRRAPVSAEDGFQPREFAPNLERMASLSEQEFRDMFRGSAVTRARYRGFLRNVIVAMGNASREEYRGPLERLAEHHDEIVREHAVWALGRLEQRTPRP